jgi:hypothetical protein
LFQNAQEIRHNISMLPALQKILVDLPATIFGIDADGIIVIANYHAYVC